MKNKILLSDFSLTSIVKQNLSKRYGIYIKEVNIDSNMIRIICFSEGDTARLEENLAKDYIKTSHFSDDLLGIFSESRVNFMNLLLKNDISYQVEEAAKMSSSCPSKNKYNIS